MFQRFFADQMNGANVWWFPAEFSQSKLGDRVIGSNACTLICVLLAGRIHEFNLAVWVILIKPLSRLLVNIQ